MSDDYLWDPRSAGVAADEDVRRLETLLERYRHVERDVPRWRHAPRRAGLWVLAALAAAALFVAWLALRGGDVLPHWRVEGLAGRATWSAGEVLENRSGRAVRVKIGAIGELTIANETRGVAEDCGGVLHSLRLERGHVRARIVGPPRLFQIDTPSGRTIDLGCEYELSVDDSGAASLRVTEGQVAFVLDGREVYVPAGARCEARPGEGPGYPEFDDRSNALSDVLVIASGVKGLEVKNPEGFFDELLSNCTDEDTLTLWHLYDAPELIKGAAVEPWIQERIRVRLARQFPFPEGVTAEALANGDRSQRRAWRDSMQPAWRVANRSTR